MSWFTTGQDGFIKKQQIDNAIKAKKEKLFIQRFWIKENQETKIIFLGDKHQGFFCNIHTQYKPSQRILNHYTCVADFKPCPFCLSGDKPKWTAHYSIIDLTPYTDKNNNIIKYSKKILAIKGATIYKIKEEIIDKYQNLEGLVVKVKRYAEDKSSCGSVFTVEKRINLQKTFAKDLKLIEPFNFEEILAPPTEDDYKLAGVSQYLPNAIEQQINFEEEETLETIETKIENNQEIETNNDLDDLEKFL